MQPHFVIVESRVYPELVDSMYYAAFSQLNQQGITTSRVTVPQLFDIPAAIRLINDASRQREKEQMVKEPSGFIVLGAHTSLDAKESYVCEVMRSVHDLSHYFGFEVGFGLVYENSMDFLKNSSKKLTFTAQLAVHSCLALFKLRQQLAHRQQQAA